jgi:hypothetical protein
MAFPKKRHPRKTKPPLLPGEDRYRGIMCTCGTYNGYVYGVRPAVCKACGADFSEKGMAESGPLFN